MGWSRLRPKRLAFAWWPHDASRSGRGLLSLPRCESSTRGLCVAQIASKVGVLAWSPEKSGEVASFRLPANHLPCRGRRWNLTCWVTMHMTRTSSSLTLIRASHKSSSTYVECLWALQWVCVCRVGACLVCFVCDLFTFHQLCRRVRCRGRWCGALRGGGGKSLVKTSKRTDPFLSVSQP